jgi:hypothetical protein
MAQCLIVDGAMEEVVSDQLVLKGGKSMRRIIFVATVQPLPINQVRPADPAFTALVGRHFLQLFEAV